MTSIPTSEGTGDVFTVPLETTARHRPDAVPVSPPTWFLLALTGTAAVTAIWAAVTASLPLMLLALLYAVIAFAADVWAAIARRQAER